MARAWRPTGLCSGWLGLAGLIGLVGLIGLIGLSAGSRSGLAQPAPSAWPPAAVNPKPAAGDVVLPLPCGAGMVFRRIDTPTGPNPLDDRGIILGNADPETDYSEYVRADAVAGGFRDPDGTRYFLLGKYEVSTDQYQALIAQDCPTPSPAGKLPKTKVSWFEAVQFAHLYTLWLHSTAAGRLPARGGRKAFVRLPTEAEWEYAARGGAAVSAADFRARLFPMTEPTEKYAWFGSARSANGTLRPIGLLLPNPLGLHDLIGNAAELVLDSFRLNKVGRPHGQAGGMVLRGGDYETPEERLRSSFRVEVPPYDDAAAQPVRLPAAGFRLALAVPTGGDLADADALRTAFADLSRSRLPQAANPSDLLDALVRQTEDPALKSALTAVATSLAKEIRLRNEKEAGAIRASLRMGTLLIRTLRDYKNRLDVVSGILSNLSGVPDQRQQGEELKKTIEGLRTAYDFTFALYADTVVEAQQYDADRIAPQLTLVLEEYRRPGQSPKLVEWAQMFHRHVLAYQRNARIDKAGWSGEILR